MHIALIANASWLDEELSQFRYLVVGLIDEQVHVAQVLPDGIPGDEISGFAHCVSWRDSRWSLCRSFSLRRQAETLEHLGVDLFHALDVQVWGGTVALAKKLGVPAVLSTSCASDLSQVDRLRRAVEDRRLAFSAATDPLARAIADKIGDDSVVRVIPPGVHVPKAPITETLEDRPLCAVISGSGQADAEYESLFEAMRSVIAAHPQTQFFMDNQGSDPHTLWRMADRYGVLSNTSIVPRRLGHRELLLRAGVLIHPQPLGRARSLTLQAMAAGIPVIARLDPWLDYLLENHTAWLVEEADPRRWEQLILRLLVNRDAGRQLGLRARQWVSEHHVAAQQVAATLQFYQRQTGESLKFPGT